MAFLPIAERELRVRARQKNTYRLRVGAALIAILIVAFMLVISPAVTSPTKFGAGIFWVLAAITFLYALLEGISNTADCLSEEKRAGTLGLLFLTDLKGYDVVLGKLTATSLNSFYGLLAVLPPLALPLLLGGVTAGEFWRLVLVLMNTLFFSLTAGLFVSAMSRDQRKARGYTMAILLLFAAIVPLLRMLPFLPTTLLQWMSPTMAFYFLPDAKYAANPNLYWTELGGIHALGWLFLISASLILPKAWQDRPGRVRTARLRPVTLVRAPELLHRERRRLLNANPVLWMAELAGGQKIYLRILIALACGAALLIWLINPGSSPISIGLLVGALGLHFVLALWVASQACYLFSETRDSGALELLISTPLTVREIIQGHFLALKRFFGQPVIALICFEGLLLAGQIYLLAHKKADPWLSVPITGAAAIIIVIFFLDLHAAAWFGMWAGLSSRRASKAFARTVLFVLILPHLFGLCFGPLWPVIAVVKNLIFINYAQDQLRRQFRRLVTEQFAFGADHPPASEPTKGYPQLPSVREKSADQRLT